MMVLVLCRERKGEEEEGKADGVLAGAVDGVEGQGVEPAFGGGDCDAALLGWRGLASEVAQEELDAVDCAEEVDVDCLEVGLLRWGGGTWCSDGGEEGAICDAGVGGEDGDAGAYAGAAVECFEVWSAVRLW